jgi:predicted XRE-type DNA-binding protein
MQRGPLPMNEKKLERLRAKGWTETSVQKFLDLTDPDTAYIKLKLNLSRTLREKRLARGLTQTQFADLVQSSQSRVSKMEGGDLSISIDLLVRGLLALGATKEELAEVISA